MTKNWLEFDQKNSHRQTLTLELDLISHHQTLTFELDQNMDEFDRK